MCFPNPQARLPSGGAPTCVVSLIVPTHLSQLTSMGAPLLVTRRPEG